MNRTDYIVVLCTCPDSDSAERIAGILVSEKLAACVNQIPGITSSYWWQGKVEQDQEIQLLIKSRAAIFDQLKAAIIDAHPYDVPEIVALPVTDGHEPYLDWIGQSTQ